MSDARILELQADRDRWRERAAIAEAERDRLREALQLIASGMWNVGREVDTIDARRFAHGILLAEPPADETPDLKDDGDD